MLNTVRRSFRGSSQLWRVLKVVTVLPLVAVDADQPSTEHWEVVQDYLDRTKAYGSDHAEIRRAEIPEEEKERRIRDLGSRPDDAPAIAAAKAIIEANGHRIREAAEFLLDRFPPNYPGNVQQMALDALATKIGPDWGVVEAYIDSADEIMAAIEATQLESTSAKERQLRVLVDRGPRPTTSQAIAAAMAIIRSGGSRSPEAAEFLIEQNYALRPTGAMVSWPWLGTTTRFGEQALAELVGPHWQVVQDYLDQTKAWEAAEQSIRATALDEEETARRLEQLGNRPRAHRASAAASAILDAQGEHEMTRQAAEFLLDYPTRGGAARALRGAQALATHYPDYDQWPLRLKQVNGISNVHEPAKAFVNDLAGSLEDPVARATAQYFAASYLIQSADQRWIPEYERIENQKRALALATGLSAGLETDTFILTKRDIDGAARPMTFADAEAELLESLSATQVGGFVSDVQARRVDGTEDSLSRYAGRVVFVDFWATWCGPCIAAFPKLRELHARLPGRHFQIVGVNVDTELETATDYLLDDPLPWVVWHVGDDSEIVRKWRVTGYPTYVLVAPNGRILARKRGTFDEDLRTMIEQAVTEFTEPAAATP